MMMNHLTSITSYAGIIAVLQQCVSVSRVSYRIFSWGVGECRCMHSHTGVPARF